MNTQPEPVTAGNEPMPNWWTALHLRAADTTLPDTDLINCLAYIDKLRRERDRLITQLTDLRAARTAPSVTVLDRFEAVLDYLYSRINDNADTVAISEVTGRLNGRLS